MRIMIKVCDLGVARLIFFVKWPGKVDVVDEVDVVDGVDRGKKEPRMTRMARIGAF